MIAFGFGSVRENKIIGLIKAGLAIALGTYLIITKANAMELVVQIIAGVIVLVNLFAFVIGLKYPAMQMSSGSLFSLLLAVLLFSFAGPISAVLRYIIGGFLFLAGGSQVFALISSRGMMGMGYLSLIVPVLMILGGCLFFSEELIGNDIMGLMVGVAIIMYGVSKVITVLKMNKENKVNKENPQPEKTQETKWQKFDDSSIKDVDYEKVD